MIFTDFAFLVFFPIVFVAHWLANHSTRRYILLIGSYVFYGWWDWRFLGLVGVVTIVTWCVGVLLVGGKIRDSIILATGLLILLLQLGFFKYSGFVVDNLSNIVLLEDLLNWTSTFSLILPVGISFFTFQAMSYLIDLRNGKIKTHSGIIDVALYIAFFPQLVAGPIIRGTVFFPQLIKSKKLERRDVELGVNYFLVGFVYKALVADNIATFVDRVFLAPELFQTKII